MAGALSGRGELTHGLALEDAYSARETIELAYVVALQHVPVRQRAVFILRHVMGFRAAETAEILDMTVAAVNSSLQRARTAIEDRLPRVSQQAELDAMGLGAVDDLARSYARAIEADDLVTPDRGPVLVDASGAVLVPGPGPGRRLSPRRSAAPAVAPPDHLG